MMFESSSPVPFACCKKCVKWTLGEIAKTASPCDITGGAQSRWFHDNRLQGMGDTRIWFVGLLHRIDCDFTKGTISECGGLGNFNFYAIVS